jgi:asparagine synthase (glutamine-hydrolysing)
VTGIAAVLDRSALSDADMASSIARMAHRLSARGTVANDPFASSWCATIQCGRPQESSGRSRQVDPALRIAADARIDNPRELEAELGRDVAELDDPSLILRAYRRWGVDCAARLLGDFAFVIADSQSRTLYLARDVFGIRPLYYHADASGFRCASSMQALLAEVSSAPNLDQVALYIAQEFTEADETLYRDVRALPPATWMMVSRGSMRLRRYWEADPWRRLAGNDSEETSMLLREALGEAVRCRMPARERVAVLVSGGLDSATVAGQCETQRRMGHGPDEPTVVAHVRFPGMPCDESSYSDAIAAHWSLPRIETSPLSDPEVTRPRLEGVDPDLYYDPRLGMWCQILAAVRKEGIETVLTGEGGDWILRGTGAEWADDLRRGRLAKLARESGVGAAPWRRSRWRALWSGAVGPWLPPTPFDVGRSMRDHGDREVFAPSFAELVAQSRVDRRRRDAAIDAPDAVTRELCAGLRAPPEPQGVAWIDRLAAGQDVEIRHPFLDRRVVELLLAVPHAERHVVGRDKPKPILRRAARDLVPESVLGRQDSAEYSCYFREALNQRHRGALTELFQRSRLVEAGVVAREQGRKLSVADPTAMRAVIRVAHLVAMEIWLRQVG